VGIICSLIKKGYYPGRPAGEEERVGGAAAAPAHTPPRFAFRLSSYQKR